MGHMITVIMCPIVKFLTGRVESATMSRIYPDEGIAEDGGENISIILVFESDHHTFYIPTFK